jgi:hypothetical protein
MGTLEKKAPTTKRAWISQGLPCEASERARGRRSPRSTNALIYGSPDSVIRNFNAFLHHRAGSCQARGRLHTCVWKHTQILVLMTTRSASNYNMGNGHTKRNSTGVPLRLLTWLVEVILSPRQPAWFGRAEGVPLPKQGLGCGNG